MKLFFGHKGLHIQASGCSSVDASSSSLRELRSNI